MPFKYIRQKAKDGEMSQRQLARTIKAERATGLDLYQFRFSKAVCHAKLEGDGQKEPEKYRIAV